MATDTLQAQALKLPHFRFRSADEVRIAASLFDVAFPRTVYGDPGEWVVEVSPGTFSLRNSRSVERVAPVLRRLTDVQGKLFKAEQAGVGTPSGCPGEGSFDLERYETASGRCRWVDPETGESYPDEDEGRGKITGWSWRSRLRMRRSIAQLDHSTLLLSGEVMVMVTLTYPGDWLASAPSAEVVKTHLRAFRKRWGRKFGGVRGLWKLEFQRRGAPHLHLGLAIRVGVINRVELRNWVRAAWAEIVGAPVESKHALAGASVDWSWGGRASDPRRLASYFDKHASGGAKEYQHEVPAEWKDGGSGRFWGIWGAEKTVATSRIGRDEAVVLRRTHRRWLRSKSFARKDGKFVRRSQRSLNGRASGYWVMVNDGVTFAALASRLVCPNVRSTPASTYVRLRFLLDTNRRRLAFEAAYA